MKCIGHKSVRLSHSSSKLKYSFSIPTVRCMCVPIKSEVIASNCWVTYLQELSDGQCQFDTYGIWGSKRELVNSNNNSLFALSL